MKIINDNDMEIILKGDQKEAIRKMLDNRLFCLIKMPGKKPEKYTSKCSSSVFLTHINNHFRRSFAIRNTDSNTEYEDCEYYLTVFYRRGTDDKDEYYFEDSISSENDMFILITRPTTEDLLSFLTGKELVLITNYMHYGNFEQFKIEDFTDDILFIRKECGSDFLMRDEFLDIKVFLTRADDGYSYPEYGMYPEDVREFEIRKRIVNLLKLGSELYDNEHYYSAEYESHSKDVQAAYFLTRFHSNMCWDADPVNIVNTRISAFVLPGTTSSHKLRDLPDKKKTRKTVGGTEYMIESIHVNSDILPDLDDLKDYLDSYFDHFGLD